MEIIGYAASIIIGLSLGLIGGGGSILTLPILVYLFKVEPEIATSYSLFIVGITSLVGAFKNYKNGNIQFKPSLYFSIPSVILVLVVRKILLPKIPDYLFNIGSMEVTKNLLLMMVFAILMVFASASMIKKRHVAAVNVNIHPVQLLGIGAAVGMVTGFLGAGGGFLIIPALIYFAGLSMKQAIGTSLVIIAINSLIGFGSDMVTGFTVNYTLLLSVSALAIVGMFIGTVLSKKIKDEKLKPIFGWFVLVMGLYIIVKELIH